ncbi:hypothetical protein MEO39_26550 [Dolichospermum sp. ST_sed2]|nr:hypothetical protein [Dolichospermum sp. ST_sed2]
MSRNRNWCFTLNNPTNAPTREQFTGANYIVYQLEQGDNGNIHYQGYVEFEEKKSLDSLRRMLAGAHFEIRRGSQQDAINYCKKQDTRLAEPYEDGIPKQQGKRSDLDEIRNAIIKGESNESIADNYFGQWVRYHRSFTTYRNLKQPPRTWKTEVYMCYGPPGTGKSKYALESSEPTTQYWKQRSQWWDLYENQVNVILDDYYGWLPWDVLLRILDRYPLLVETKGGQVNFTAKKIFITTNSKPDTWYKDSPNFKALTRRIEHWIWFKNENTVVDFPNWELFNKATA